jgi:predicted acetyltransferase
VKKNPPSAMKADATKPRVLVEVIPATPDQSPILANLLELYAHDFSEFHDIELREDGRFGYRSLPLYWSEPDRHPFLVRIDGKLAGLVLVKRGSELSGNENVWDIAEFFVMRGYRRRGMGTQIAHKVWKHFPGAWEVRVMQSNAAAFHFWRHAIAKFTDATVSPQSIEKDGVTWQLFSFESRRTT